MKTKVLLAAVAVAFSFAVTSCGNKRLQILMQLRQILAVLQKQNKYVTLQRHVARLLIQQRVLRLHVMVPSVTNLVRRSNSELVLN